MVDYENPWYYNGTPFTSQDIGDYYGFVYRIDNLVSGRSYIGRKYFWSLRKPRGKSRRVKSESNWKKYYGSSEELARDVKELGREKFRRTILSLHCAKGKVNFEETRQLFLNEVLSQRLTDGSPLYYNSNILGRYYRKDYFDS